MATITISIKIENSENAKNLPKNTKFQHKCQNLECTVKPKRKTNYVSFDKKTKICS